MNKFIGKRFGLLVVLRRGTKDKHGHWSYVCQCDCGNIAEVQYSNLSRGSTTSCGCVRKKVAAEKAAKMKTHGCEPKRLYRIWRGMLSRCYTTSCTEYHNYGARGITVCDAWRFSFEPFRDWAFANGYSETLTIDRIDNNGAYTPENCRWVSMLVQSNNSRKNRLVSHNGEVHTMAEWSRILGVSYDTIRYKVKKYGNQF